MDIHHVFFLGKAECDGSRHQARQRGEQGQAAFSLQFQRHTDNHLVQVRAGFEGQPRHHEVGPHEFDHEIEGEAQRTEHGGDVGFGAERPVKRPERQEPEQKAEVEAAQADFAQKKRPDQRQNQVEGKAIHAGQYRKFTAKGREERSTLRAMTTLSLLQAPHLSVPHAFSTRAGGVSGGAYAGLNLDDREDDPQAVAENRARLARALGFAPSAWARLNQVHGTDVIEVAEAGVWEGDALVTRTPGLLLAIGTADCYPLLLADEEAGVIGAAHAGWKGTLGRIGERTVQAMTRLGARPERIHAAIGPGICAAQYEVGEDTAQQFEAGGLGEWVVRGGPKPHLDLAGANRQILREAGVQDIWVSGRCSTETDFYSYRRDAGQTGRMWAVIGLKEARA